MQFFFVIPVFFAVYNSHSTCYSMKISFPISLNGLKFCLASTIVYNPSSASLFYPFDPKELCMSWGYLDDFLSKQYFLIRNNQNLKIKFILYCCWLSVFKYVSTLCLTYDLLPKMQPVLILKNLNFITCVPVLTLEKDTFELIM